MKTRIVLATAVVAALGACTSYDPSYPTANPPVVTAPNAGTSVGTSTGYGYGVVTAAPILSQQPLFRPGWGTVESVAMVRPAPVVSSSAGASTQIYRVSVRMQDGSVQAFDVDHSLAIGERVELTADGRVIRGPV